MNRVNIDWLTSYLDAHDCHYEINSFSHDFSDQEMMEISEPLGVTLIKTHVARISGRNVMLAVRSKNLLDPDKVKVSFQTEEVSLLPRDAVAEVLPAGVGGEVPPFAPLLHMDLVMDQSVAMAKSVKFRVNSGNDFLRMDFQDFKRLFQPRLNNLQMSSFRAGVSAVVPPSAAKTWELLESCFIGISLDNANFEGARLDAVLRWAGKHFRKVCILVADSIHRITLRILDPSLSEAQARQEALALGKSFAETNEGFFRGKKYACKFDVVFCSDLEGTPSFPPFLRDLKGLFETHQRFQKSVRDFAEGFIEKKYATGQMTDLSTKERSIAWSIDYFLEELALSACLMESGHWPVLVYPGSLTVFTDMIEDGFDSDLPVVTLLHRLVSLSLNLKGD